MNDSTSSNYVVPTEWFIPGLTILGVCGILSFVTTVIFCIRSINFFGNPRRCVGNKLVILSLVTMMLSLTYPILDFYYLFITINSRQVKNNNSHLISTVYIQSFIAENCYTTSLVFMYSTLLMRIYIAFKQDMSRKEITVGIIIILLWVGYFVCGNIIVLSLWTSLIEFNLPPWTDAVVLAAGSVLDIIASGFFLYIFLKRLYKMISHLDEPCQTLTVDPTSYNFNAQLNINISDNDDEYSNLSSNSSTNIDQVNQAQENIQRSIAKQMEIVELITKISLLTIIWEFILQTWLITAIVFQISMAERKDEDSLQSKIFESKMTIIAMSIRGICACSNCFVLYAAFIYNNDQYAKSCGMLHNGLKRCCTWCAANHSYSLKRHRRGERNST